MRYKDGCLVLYHIVKPLIDILCHCQQDLACQKNLCPGLLPEQNPINICNITGHAILFLILYHLSLSLRIFGAGVRLRPHGFLLSCAIIAFEFCGNKNVHELLKFVHEEDSL